MAPTDRCPVCKGVGIITTDPPIDSSGANPSRVTCYNCGGLGQVEVTDA